MGLLTPSNNEILLHRQMFEEKLYLIGIPAKVFNVLDLNQDFNFKLDNVSYAEPIDVNIIFEDFPTIATLKRYNWFRDDEGTVAPIALLPWFKNDVALDPQIGTKVRIIDPLGKIDRDFIVTEVNANNYYMIHYAVKLAPYRDHSMVEEDKVENKENSDGNFSFIRR